MVDTLFNLLESTRATTVKEMKEERLRTLTGMAMGTRDLTPEARKAMARLVSLFLSLGFGNLTGRYLPRRGEPKKDSGKLPEEEKMENGESPEEREQTDGEKT